MTDTARSVNDLKAITSDSGNHLRDVIESIANPVAGGGFDYNVGGKTFVAERYAAAGIDGVYDTYTKATATGIGAVGDRIILWSGTVSDTVKTLYDPAGWLNPAPVADSGYWGTGNWPAGTIMHLPPGVYMWVALLQLAVPLTAGSFYLYFDFVNSPAAAGTALMRAAPHFGDGVSSSGAGSAFSSSSGSFVCDETTYALPDIFATAGVLPSPDSIVRVRLNVVKCA